MRKGIQLYEYQKDMLRQIEDAFVTHQSVMVQVPTGTGKTVLISEVVKREERRVKNPCVWIVVHRRELVEQIKETLERRLGTSLDAEREKSNVIEVFSIQWLSRHYQEQEGRPSLIVIDEAHHAQLIYTAHNTHLLNTDFQRRDQVYFVNKRDDGCSELYSLYDFKDFRDNYDMEKAYLQGRFDAIPYLTTPNI